LVALLEHPLATLTQEAARTLVDHPGATEKRLLALGNALFEYSPFFTKEIRDQLSDALKRRDERIWGMAKLAHF
jgi:hypothetical protein